MLQDTNIRDQVAKNPSTPSDALILLASDETNKVRSEVGSNPSTPVEVLQQLSQDENIEVRLSVSSNTNAPVSALKLLASNEHGEVRRCVASNPSTPVEVLQQLSQDESSRVRQSVAQNPSTPVELLSDLYAGFINDSSLAKTLIIEMLSNGLQLSQAELEALVAQGDQGIAQAVAKNLVIPKNSVLALQLDSYKLEYQTAVLTTSNESYAPRLV